jgi:hypothetical protein
MVIETVRPFHFRELGNWTVEQGACLLSSCSALQPDPIFYLSQTLSIQSFILTFPYHSAGMIGGDALLVQEVE